MVRVPIDAVLHVGHVGAVGFAGEITVGELDHRRADVCRLPCSVSMTRGSRASVAELKREPGLGCAVSWAVGSLRAGPALFK